MQPQQRVVELIVIFIIIVIAVGGGAFANSGAHTFAVIFTLCIVVILFVFVWHTSGTITAA